MKDSVIIVSGGMDSITMLYEFKDRIALGISFDYGSNHNAREIPFRGNALQAVGDSPYHHSLGLHAQVFQVESA